MEQGKDFPVKPYIRKPYLKTRSNDSGRMKITFRSAARQVWIANSFRSKHHAGIDEPLKTTEGNQKMVDGNTLEAISFCPSRPPSVKRRGTPDIFPMSSEMRKTLVLLGNLDLLPEEEKQKQDELVQAEKKKKLNSFRQKAQMRVIQPQRFLRSFRRNGGKNAEKNTSNELENINSTADSLINSRASNNTSSLSPKDEQTEQNNDSGKLENILSNDEDDGRELQDDNKNLAFSNSSLREQKRSARNPWQKAIKRHQHGHVVPNASNPFFVRKRFHHQSKRDVFSKTWQPRSMNVHETFPSIKRASSLGSPRPRTFSSQPAGLNIKIDDYTDPINDGKTIDEITSDIQERCSKWFEFRQKVLTKSWENKLI